MIKDYKDLIAWQKSYSLVLDVYRATKAFPDDEKYSLTLQARRSAVSIPSNIAEGYGRNSRQQYSYSLSVSLGSARELETQILIAHDIGFMDKKCRDALIQQIDDVSALLYSLIRSLDE